MSPIYYSLIPYILYPVITFLISLTLTRLCIRILPLFGVISYPDEDRHIHNKPIPTGGGIAIVVAFLITAGVYLFSLGYHGTCFKYHGVICTDFVYKLLVPIVILILAGMLDDRFALRAKYKLTCQFLICMVCWYNGVAFNSILGFVLPGYISFFLTVAWIFFFMNAFNLIDGVDGLAAGLGIVASVCMGIVFIISRYSSEAILILCLGAACLGFLRYNFYPARLFMGETGSTFIGFMFGIIGIVSSNKALTLSAVLIPILAIGVPMFDGFLAVWRRVGRKVLNQLEPRSIKKNSKVFYGDREHIHHRFLNKGWSQRKTTLVLYCFALFLAMFAVISVLFHTVANGLILIVILMIIISAIRQFADIELWDSAQIAILGLHKPRIGFLVSLLHPVFDIIFIVLALLITQFLFCDVFSFTVFLRFLHYNLLYSLFPIVIILHVTGIYRIHWLRVNLTDLLYLFKMISLGAVLGFIINYFFVNHTSIKLFIAQYGMFYLLINVFILSERIFLRYLRFISTKKVS